MGNPTQCQLEAAIAAIPDILISKTDHLLYLIHLLRSLPVGNPLLQHIPYHWRGFSSFRPKSNPVSYWPNAWMSPPSIPTSVTLSSLARSRQLPHVPFPTSPSQAVNLSLRYYLAPRKPGQVARCRGLTWILPKGTITKHMNDRTCFYLGAHV